MTDPVEISEAEFERMLDGRVQRALSYDARYLYAANADEQASAEAAIERECEDSLRLRFVPR